MTSPAPITVERPEGRFRLSLPDWGAWLSMIDAASRGEGEGADVDILLRRWLKASVEVCWTGEDRYAVLTAIADLPAELADALSTSIFVMGVDTGLDFINQLKGVECVIVDGENVIHTSNNIHLDKQ